MRYVPITLALTLAAAVSCGAPAPRYVCTVANDRTNLTYRAGESAVFHVTVADTNGVKASSGMVTAELDNFGVEKFASFKIDLAKDNPFSVTGRLAEAGFLRLKVSGGDVAPRVWSVAYDPTLIRAATDRPDDFMSYWKSEKERLAREVPPDVKVTPMPDRSKDGWDVSAVSFATFGGKRVYGFISVPKDKAKAPFPVLFNVPGAGPGARDAGRKPGVVSMVMNVHPYDPLSGEVKALYDAQNKELGAKWNVPGYATSGVSGKREDYFFHDAILGIDRALDWVAARPDVDKARIRYSGSSQGGGFGLILTGLNGKISRLVVNVPAITDLLGRRAGRQSGWPMIYECQRTDEARAAAEKIAPYFDAVHFASYITCPVRMAVGFSDTCCAPPAVYSAFNAIPSKDKKMLDGYGMGHTICPEFHRQFGKWLDEPAEAPAAQPSAVPEQTSALAPNRFTKLPLGAIRPEGWLAHHIGLQRSGLAGTLYEHSEWLAPDNGWLNPGINHWKFPRKDGWEEQSYWFRTFVKLAALTEDPRLLNVTRIWVDKIIAGADKDGWFGAQNKKGIWWHGQYMTDIWGHMPMCEALWSWREYSGDPRIAPLLVNFFRFCNSLPEDQLILHVFPDRGDYWRYTIQYPRSCDMNPVLYACYEATGEKVCLDLAGRLFRRRRKPKSYIDRHNVNFAQLFAYETVFSRQSGSRAHRMAADFWYDLHMDMWGQMPRGAFAADENCRAGNVDPRYGTESCTWGELSRSFQFLGALTGETKWADRTEDILFNHYPVSYTPDWKRLHYLTAPNQVMQDVGWDHDYGNYPPQIAYSDKAYRCCRHNAGLAMPLFAEHLALTDADGTLVFWMYAPHRGDAALKGGRTTWRMDTRYPFREQVALTLNAPAGKPVPLRFRVPGWAKSFEVAKDGSRIAAAGKGEPWLTVPAAASGTYEIRMAAESAYRFWPRNGAVTVERGPLSYSLAIGEETRETPRPVAFVKESGSAVWPESPEAIAKADKYVEYLPTTPWNYGLDVSGPPQFRECAWSEDCFTLANAPCEMLVKGRRLPEWTLQDHQPAPLQESPAYSAEPLETLRFVPLGCARLRLSVLPVAVDSPSGVRWERSPASIPRARRAPIIDF